MAPDCCYKHFSCLKDMAGAILARRTSKVTSVYNVVIAARTSGKQRSPPYSFEAVIILNQRTGTLCCPRRWIHVNEGISRLPHVTDVSRRNRRSGKCKAPCILQMIWPQAQIRKMMLLDSLKAAFNSDYYSKPIPKTFAMSMDHTRTPSFGRPVFHVG